MKKKKRMSREAATIRVLADWMLERASEEEWYPDRADEDHRTWVMTTAKSRRIATDVDSREACRTA